MKKEILFFLIFFIIFLGFLAGRGVVTTQPADSWLGTWDVTVKIPDCPGPAADGSWPGTFVVSGTADGYSVKWLYPDYTLKILSISGSHLRALNVDEPVQNEWYLTLKAGGQQAEGYIEQQKPYGGPTDPCRRGTMVAVKRGAPTQGKYVQKTEKKVESGQFRCEIVRVQVEGRKVFVEGRAYGGSGNYIYFWDFGDISSSTPSGALHSHEYECPQKYRIRLVVQDTGMHIDCFCDREIEIRVFPMYLGSPFLANPVPGSYPDASGDYYMVFQSAEPEGGVPPYKFHWDFGDNRRHIPDTYGNPIRHSYWNPGTYKVELNIYDACNNKLGPISQSVEVGGPKTSPSAGSVPSLIVNGDFNTGLSGWIQSAGGYSGNPNPASQSRFSPVVSSGVMEIGVFGGTRQVFQDIQLSHLNVRFSAKFMVKRWSTYSGKPGGWAAVGMMFLDTSGKVMATTYFYTCPTEPFGNRPGLRWIHAGNGAIVPTGWMTANLNIDQEAKAHGLDPGSIATIRIICLVFGTHEDRSPTVARFDDLVLY